MEVAGAGFFFYNLNVLLSRCVPKRWEITNSAKETNDKHGTAFTSLWLALNQQGKQRPSRPSLRTPGKTSESTQSWATEDKIAEWSAKCLLSRHTRPKKCLYEGWLGKTCSDREKRFGYKVGYHEQRKKWGFGYEILPAWNYRIQDGSYWRLGKKRDSDFETLIKEKRRDEKEREVRSDTTQKEERREKSREGGRGGGGRRGVK